MMRRSEKVHGKEHLLVILLFIFLTAIFTYPSITRISNDTIGGGDAFQSIWNIWHIERSLSEEVSIESIYNTDMLFQPVGIDLKFHTLSLTNTLFIGYPLTFLTSNYVFIYNILIFLTFVLSGYGMFLLSKYLTGHNFISLIAGFLFAFSPIHISRAFGHLNLSSIQWMPFFVLFLMKSLKEPGWKNPVIAAIFLFLLTLSSWILMKITFVLTLGYLIYHIMYERKRSLKDISHNLLTFTIVFSVLIAPFAIPLFNAYMRDDNPLMQGRETTTLVEPQFFITPNAYSPIWGDNFSGDIPSGTNVFNTYTGIILIIVSLIMWKNVFWIIMSLIFVIFSIFPENILLEMLKVIFPFLSISTLTGRFAIGFLFTSTIIVALTLKKVIRYRSMRRKTNLIRKIPEKVILSAVLILIAIEVLSVPFKMTDGQQNEIRETFDRIGITDNDILIWNEPSMGNPFSMYLQTFHQNSMMGGYTSRYNFQALQSINFLKNEVHNVYDVTRFIMINDIDFIIFYEDISHRLTFNSHEHAKDIFSRVNGLEIVSDNDIENIIIYRLN